jgi:hypothetical protein
MDELEVKKNINFKMDKILELLNFDLLVKNNNTLNNNLNIEINYVTIGISIIIILLIIDIILRFK